MASLANEFSVAQLVEHPTGSRKAGFESSQGTQIFFLCPTLVTNESRGRCGGLVVSALDSGSRGPGSSPGRVIVLCSWTRHFTLTVPLYTQEYKWVPANCQGNLTKYWEVTCDGLASHPRGVAIFLVTSCYRNRGKLRQ